MGKSRVVHEVGFEIMSISFVLRRSGQAGFPLGFFFVYSLLACDLSDHGEIMYSPFPLCCPRSGGPLQAPPFPSPGPVPRRLLRTKGSTKERKASVKDKGKNKGKAPPSPQTVPADAMKSSVERNSGSSPSPGSSAPAPRSYSHSRSPASDTSLTASSSADTRLPTSMVARKSNTARPRLSSARRSRIFHQSFHLPVSFRTSAHRIFCWAFHSGHTLKRCSRVWFGHRHHQHCGVGCKTHVQLGMGS